MTEECFCHALSGVKCVVCCEGEVCPVRRNYHLRYCSMSFCRGRGNSYPMSSFLRSLSAGVHTGMLNTITLLRTGKPRLQRPCSGFVKSKVFRVHTGRDDGVAHILCFFCVKGHVILAGNFVGGARGAPSRRVTLTGGCHTSCLRQGRGVS